jgi:hypothetical protein
MLNEETVNAGTGEVVIPETEGTVKPNPEGQPDNADPIKDVGGATDDGEDVKDKDKTKQDAELNAKFAAVRRKTEQETRDKLVKELAEKLKWGEDIKDYASLQEAIKEQQARAEAEATGVDVEIIKEKNQLKEENEKYRSQAMKQQQYADFFKSYPHIDIKTVPIEVWTEFNAGHSLVDAYARHENKLLKEKLAKFEKENKADEKNDKNKKASTGSVADKGGVDPDFISEEEFDSKKKNGTWVKENLDVIKKSQRKWLKK